MRMGSAIRRGLVVGVVAATGVVAAVVLFRIELAERLVRHGLARAGFPEATLRVEEVSFRRLRIVDLRASDQLTAAEVDARLDLTKLPTLPVERLRVAHAKVVLPAPQPSAESSKPSEPTDLPLALLPALELEDVTVEGPTAYGPVRVVLASTVENTDGALHMKLVGTASGADSEARLETEARLEPGGTVSMSVNVPSLRAAAGSMRVASGHLAATLELETRGLGLRSGHGVVAATLAGVASGGTTIGAVSLHAPLAYDAADGAAVKISAADARLADLHLRLSGIEASAAAATIDVRSIRIEDTGTPRRFEPLELSVHEATAAGARRFIATLLAAGRRAKLDATGELRTPSGEAFADLRFPRTTFATGGLQPVDLSNRLEALGALRGAIAADAQLRWTRAHGLESRVRFDLDDVSTSTGGVSLEGIAGTVALASLTPPRTAEPQTLHVRRLASGVELGDLTLRWGLEGAATEPGARLHLHELSASLAGGRIVLDETTIDPHGSENRLVFRFEQIDVERLFALAGIAGVSGTGRLGGSVPIAMRGNAVAVEDGLLESKTGVLQIRSEQAARMLAGGGSSVDLLVQALRDFHYDHLAVKVKKAVGGEAAVTIALEGNNPAVLDGYPFRINLNVSGNFDPIIGSLLEVARLSDRAVRAVVDAVR